VLSRAPGALSDALSRARENQATKKSTKYRSKGWQPGSEKETTQGLPKTQLYSRSLYSQGNQKRVSKGRSSDVVHERWYTCCKMPFQKFGRTTMAFTREESGGWQAPEANKIPESAELVQRKASRSSRHTSRRSGVQGSKRQKQVATSRVSK
jgi:hypothetical protein